MDHTPGIALVAFIFVTSGIVFLIGCRDKKEAKKNIVREHKERK